MLIPAIVAAILFSQILANPTPLPRNGIGGLVGYGSTVYQAIDYEPVCGTLDNAMTQSFDVSGLCGPAMSSYNVSSDRYAFYDQTGVRLSVAPVSVAGCICFSLGALS